MPDEKSEKPVASPKKKQKSASITPAALEESKGGRISSSRQGKLTWKRDQTRVVADSLQEEEDYDVTTVPQKRDKHAARMHA